MNDLRRSLAPIPDPAWEEIEAEARRTLETYLTARKLVDLSGPHGWGLSAVNIGRAERMDQAPADGVEARKRAVRPLVELRVPFTLSMDELDAVARGAADPDLGPVIDACRRLAAAEDRLVFHGYDAGGVRGVCAASEHAAVGFGDDVDAFPGAIAEGMEKLRDAGVGGPYGVALTPDAYNVLAKAVVSGGYSLIRHVERLIDGPVVWAPALDQGVLLSLRGGDFELTVGRDVSIGYLAHDTTKVGLYLEESLTFRTLTPEAAVALTGPSAGQRRRGRRG